jgi:hypothetical protein
MIFETKYAFISNLILRCKYLITDEKNLFLKIKLKRKVYFEKINGTMNGEK